MLNLYTDGSVSSEVCLFVSFPLVCRRRTYGLALCYLLFLFNPSRAVADFTGTVVSVLDGDTSEVLHDQHPERIHLGGIDIAWRRAKRLGKERSKPSQIGRAGDDRFFSIPPGSSEGISPML